MRSRFDVGFWLNLFSLHLVLVLMPVFIFILLVTPIRPDIPSFVEVPASTSAQMSPEFEGDVHITVLRDGRVFLHDELIGTGTLGRRLGTLRSSRRKPPTVRLRVDRAAPFGRVRNVVRAAGAAGYPKVTIMVERPEWVYVWH